MSGANTQIRERIKQTREQLAEARSRRAAAVQERDEAKTKFAQAQHDGPVDQWPEFGAAQEAVARLGGIDDEVNALLNAQNGLLQMIGESDEEAAGSALRHNGGESAENQWSGGALLLDPDGAYQRARQAGIFTQASQFGTVNVGQVATREDSIRFLTELPSATPGPVTSAGQAVGAFPTDRRGIQPFPMRPLRFLDLIPTGTTDANLIEYVQVTAIPSGATEVAELAAKPELGLTTVDATAPVRTIAGWIKIARQALEDSAGLSSLINSLLPYEVRRRVEGQILSGNGTAPNLRGILNTTGIGAPTFVAGDNVADAVLRAMTVVILADQEPNFVALHPTSWQTLLLMREGVNSGQYLYGGPGTMATATIWGLTITPSTKIPVATPLVGDASGCMLFVREGVNIKISDSDQDDFIRNRVTVLAETRVAFAVIRPAAFCKAATV